jgi:hypothetical protein
VQNQEFQETCLERPQRRIALGESTLLLGFDLVEHFGEVILESSTLQPARN